MSPHIELQPRVTCPNCWHSVGPADLLWVSSHPDLRGDPYLGDDALKRFLPSRFDVEGFALDANDARCHLLACPSCHLPVPRILTEIRPTIISVLGAPSSGKSYFLASSVWEVRKRLHCFNVTFTDADPVANQVISGYEQKLFLSDKPDQFVAIPKTEQEGELYQLVNYGDRQELYARPFVFAMRPTGGHVYLGNEKAVRKASRALCLYDNAGEHFQPTAESELSPATNHLALSEALIFVFDPLQHPRFRQRCREHSDDPQLRDEFRCHRQDEILLEAAKRIRHKANIPSLERLKRPLVVATNKYDVWARLMPDFELAQLSAYCQLGDGTWAINLSLLTAVSRGVESLLRSTAPEFVAACEGFCEDVTYIPVSPQGCSPRRVTGDQLGVRPEDLSPVWADVPLLYSINRAKNALIPSVVSKTAQSPSPNPPQHGNEVPKPHLYRGTG